MPRSQAGRQQASFALGIVPRIGAFTTDGLIRLGAESVTQAQIGLGARRGDRRIHRSLPLQYDHGRRRGLKLSVGEKQGA